MGGQTPTDGTTDGAIDGAKLAPVWTGCSGGMRAWNGLREASDEDDAA